MFYGTSTVSDHELCAFDAGAPCLCLPSWLNAFNFFASMCPCFLGLLLRHLCRCTAAPWHLPKLARKCSLLTGLQRAADAAANPAFGYDKRLAAVVSSGGSLVRGYMAEAATLQNTGAPCLASQSASSHLCCKLDIYTMPAPPDAHFAQMHISLATRLMHMPVSVLSWS